MKNLILLFALFLVASCAPENEDKSAKNNTENQEKEKPEEPEDTTVSTNSEISPDWLYSISANGEITLGCKNPDMNFHGKIIVEYNGLKFVKECEPEEDNYAIVLFPQDFGIDEYENPLWEKVDDQIFNPTVTILANDEEIVSEKSWLPVNPAEHLRTLYSIEVEFPQNPKLPQEMGTLDEKDYVGFYADKVGFHYICSDFEGNFLHLTQYTDGTVEKTSEKVIGPNKCTSGSARKGFYQPAIADANGNHEMELYVAYVNACVGNEIAYGWAEERGKNLGEMEKAGGASKPVNGSANEPKDSLIKKQLINYLNELYMVN